MESDKQKIRNTFLNVLGMAYVPKSEFKINILTQKMFKKH